MVAKVLCVVEVKARRRGTFIHGRGNDERDAIPESHAGRASTQRLATSSLNRAPITAALADAHLLGIYRPLALVAHLPAYSGAAMPCSSPCDALVARHTMQIDSIRATTRHIHAVVVLLVRISWRCVVLYTFRRHQLALAHVVPCPTSVLVLPAGCS